MSDMHDATSAVHPWVAAAAQGVRFGVETTVAADWPATRDFAQAVEGLGFDSLWLPDHPQAVGSGTWTPLAALAGATRTLRLGPLVSCVYYWNPVILARLAADVDLVSGGRLVLGLGSGDLPPEFQQLGLPWPPVRERQAALEEGLRIVRPLLRGDTVTYRGEHFRAAGAVLQPPPAQQPHVPLLVAGGGERTTLRFAARYADASNLGAAAWAGHAYSPDDARHKLAVLRGHCEAAGRPAEAVLRTALLGTVLGASPEAAQAKTAPLPPASADFFEQLLLVGTPAEATTRVRALLDAGFQYVIFLVFPFDTETLHLVAREVIPAVRAG